jgi:hypothetical protein
MYTHTYTHIHIAGRAWRSTSPPDLCMYIRVCTYTHTYSHINPRRNRLFAQRVYARMYVYTYILTYGTDSSHSALHHLVAYIYAYACVSVYIYIYTYVYIYIYTYTKKNHRPNRLSVWHSTSPPDSPHCLPTDKTCAVLEFYRRSNGYMHKRAENQKNASNLPGSCWICFWCVILSCLGSNICYC